MLLFMSMLLCNIVTHAKIALVDWLNGEPPFIKKTEKNKWTKIPLGCLRQSEGFFETDFHLFQTRWWEWAGERGEHSVAQGNL